MPSLIQLLDDKSLVVRVNAAKALEVIGTETKQAVPVLIIALKDQDEVVRRNAAKALR